ncbi:hypothetical protein T11_16622 [Trichinella zimbabwensis]|uniref:Uncharacterized protein n=1 Tax=Trichinella zimbabwensis TaxID=268475 RepID=A0A0V1GJT1_9BILA|nr:hypothetical protein T11_16622 [Trichinella zimbabwensis]
MRLLLKMKMHAGARHVYQANARAAMANAAMPR